MISYRSDQQKGFESELNMLYDAKRLAVREEHQGNELLTEYQKLLSSYEKLLRVTKKILYISDLQGMALKRCEDDIKALLNNANQGFLTFDAKGIVQKQYSDACLRILNKRPSGIHFAELLWESGSAERKSVEQWLSRLFGETDAAVKNTLLAELPGRAEIGSRQIQLEYKWIEPDPDSPAGQVVMVMMTDMTDQLQSRARAEYLSFHDNLTGLYNRAYVEAAVPGLLTAEHMPVSIVLLDMNGLKLANDVFGHQLGDRLLSQAAELIRQCFGDEALAARWGGDEFIVLLSRTGTTACTEKIERLKQACAEQESYPIQVSMAAGSATMVQPGDHFHLFFNLAEKEMYKNKLLESKQVRKSLMANINEAMYARKIEDPRHIERIERLALGLAARIGMDPQSADTINLKLLVRLHDVGKVVIPEQILGKTGSLTEEEWNVMRSHSEIGYRMALSLGEPALAEAILSMHERWDGGGYPYGLKEMQIPKLSRLLAIVDSYDIMTHDHVYRQAIGSEQALQVILEESGRQFDPNLAEDFFAYMTTTESGLSLKEEGNPCQD